MNIATNDNIINITIKFLIINNISIIDTRKAIKIFIGIVARFSGILLSKNKPHNATIITAQLTAIFAQTDENFESGNVIHSNASTASLFSFIRNDKKHASREYCPHKSITPNVLAKSIIKKLSPAAPSG